MTQPGNESTLPFAITMTLHPLSKCYGVICIGTARVCVILAGA
jgi:hypothetical protein